MLPVLGTQKGMVLLVSLVFLMLLGFLGLSAMESAMLTSKIAFPSHLSDDVTRHTEIIEREILERTKP